MSRAADAQRLAVGLNPYHAITYFAPESRDAFEVVGLRGFWRGYFAGRAAPLGRTTAPVVTACFYGFAPHMVERAIPSVWDLASPEDVLAARVGGVDRALRRVLGDDVCASAEVARAAELAQGLAQACRDAGRPLGGANRAVVPPAEPHLVLWQATTVLREDRGDAHVALLAAYGVGGCESQVLQVGVGAITREWIQAARGWTDDEWSAAHSRLETRGIVDADGVATAQGRELRRVIESRTDDLAATVFDDAGDAGARERVEELLALIEPWSGAIVETGTVPFPNPVGLPRT